MLRRIAVFKLFMTIVMQVFAQYPVIPDSIKEYCKTTVGNR